MATREPGKYSNEMTDSGVEGAILNRRKGRASIVGTYSFDNGVRGTLVITQTDLRNLKWETGKDKELRGRKDELVAKLLDIIQNGEYEGWALPDEGTHNETAYFSYYSKEYSDRVYLALRRMKTEPIYKPYTFYTEDGFRLRKGKIEKGEPIV